MKCPKCFIKKTRVVCTNPDPEGRIVRRRKCVCCGHRWYSMQYPEVSIPEHRIKWTKKGATVRPYLPVAK